MNGKLICLEGLNGCGKTSTAKALFEIMEKKARRVKLFRDPGDTIVGDKIRAIVKDPDVPMQPMAQCLMYTAARIELAHHIEPWLKSGGSVILDRWWPSTYAYQGAGGVDTALIRRLSRSLVPKICGTTPELTFFINIPVMDAMKRSGTLNPGSQPESGGDRFEAQGEKFQRRLLHLYTELWGLGEMVNINASKFNSAEETAAYLWETHVRGLVS